MPLINESAKQPESGKIIITIRIYYNIAIYTIYYSLSLNTCSAKFNYTILVFHAILDEQTDLLR